jgi:hypothetical protein
MDEEEMPQPDVSFWGESSCLSGGCRRRGGGRPCGGRAVLMGCCAVWRRAGMVVKPGKKSKTTIPESVQLHISAVRASRLPAASLSLLAA